jgi:hypothetical protein
MNCLRLLALSTILLVIPGCSMEIPEESMEIPVQHRDWYVEVPSFSFDWCAGLCTGSEALR